MRAVLKSVVLFLVVYAALLGGLLLVMLQEAHPIDAWQDEDNLKEHIAFPARAASMNAVR